MNFFGGVKFLLIILCLNGLNAKVNPIISDGQNADIAELPFLVSIQLRFISIVSHICTGVLLSENFVISSATCNFNRVLSSLRMEYGMTVITPNDQNSAQKVGVSEIIFHPGFNTTGTMDDDLCLLRSNREMLLNHLVEPYANLPISNARFMSGTRAVHASWGQTGPSVANDHLQRADLRIISMNECMAKVNDTKPPYRESICALETSVLCVGDMGAPLMVNRIVVGIGSFRNGPLCESEPGMYPNVYTALSFYIGWIESTTGISYQVNTFLTRNF